MTLKSVMLQLSDEQIVALDRAARRQGVSRSQLVRDAVDALISPPCDATIAAQYEKAYPDPVDGADEWGDLDAWHRAAQRSRSNAHDPDAAQDAW